MRHFGRGSARQIAGDIILQFGYFILLLLVSLQFLLQAGGFLGQIIGVVAFVVLDLVAADFIHLRGDFVQEVSVMGNDQKRTVVTDQIIFQPSQRIDVQMVGGLIQNEQVVLFKQDFGQGKPGFLAA